jgi:hypothetical protein
LYSFGKGSTNTAVTASPKVSVKGTSVLLEGSVTDISPGTKQNAVSANFPNGVPAVSDDSMNAWMQYVYMQQAYPTNVTGVSVKLDVIDANGNYRNIGSATSDGSGFYSYEWQPDIAGKYTVIATFEGSKAYYASYSESAFTVSEQAPTQTPTSTPVLSMADLYFVPSIVGIFVLIIIVLAIVLLLLLKKRP